MVSCFQRHSQVGFKRRTGCCQSALTLSSVEATTKEAADTHDPYKLVGAISPPPCFLHFVWQSSRSHHPLSPPLLTTHRSL